MEGKKEGIKGGKERRRGEREGSRPFSSKNWQKGSILPLLLAETSCRITNYNKNSLAHKSTAPHYLMEHMSPHGIHNPAQAGTRGPCLRHSSPVHACPQVMLPDTQLKLKAPYPLCESGSRGHPSGPGKAGLEFWLLHELAV